MPPLLKPAYSLNHLRTIGRLLHPFFRRYWWRLVVGFLSLMMVDLIQLWIPRIIKNAIDQLHQGSAVSSDLYRAGALIVFLACGVGCFRFSWRYFVLGFSRLLERDLRRQLFAHLLTLDRYFFHSRTTGELMALATNDLLAVQLATGMGAIALFDAVVMSTAALAFMAYINPYLTLIAIAPFPILALLTRTLSGQMHQQFKKVQEQFSHLTEFARSTISAIRLIKVYTQEESQTLRFDRLGQQYITNNLRVATVQGILFPASGFVANSSLLLIVFFGGRLAIQEVISVGDFVAFISYLFMLTWPMMALGWVTTLFQRALTSLTRIQAVLAEQPRLLAAPGRPLPPGFQGRIAVRALTFSYPGQSQTVLEQISLEIPSGVVGIVGRTGAGKSTLCHLLARLYPIPDHTIYLDDIDLNELSLQSVRAQIAYVPQEVSLFSDTIAANILFGDPNATPAEIEAVATIAAIHKEIVNFPDGYATKIGEKGVRLSGGQRQRIALARALLSKKKILIIDDALSAVDLETEHQIVRDLAAELRNRTCIIVSHRLAPLTVADRLVVMDNGRIVATGNHQQLFAANDFYRLLYHHQLLSPPPEKQGAPEP